MNIKAQLNATKGQLDAIEEGMKELEKIVLTKTMTTPKVTTPQKKAPSSPPPSSKSKPTANKALPEIQRVPTATTVRSFIERYKFDTLNVAEVKKRFGLNDLRTPSNARSNASYSSL